MVLERGLDLVGVGIGIGIGTLWLPWWVGLIRRKE